MTTIEEEQKMGCQHWFGYLNQKAKDEPMMESCVECTKVVECMFNHNYDSARTRALETKKKELSATSHFLLKIFGFEEQKFHQEKIEFLSQTE